MKLFKWRGTLKGGEHMCVCMCRSAHPHRAYRVLGRWTPFRITVSSQEPLTKPQILRSGPHITSGKWGQGPLEGTKDLHSEGGRPELEPQLCPGNPCPPLAPLAAQCWQ